MKQEQDLLEELRQRAAALLEGKEACDDEKDAESASDSDEDESDEDEYDEDDMGSKDAKGTNGVIKDKMSKLTKKSVAEAVAEAVADDAGTFDVASIFEGEEVSEEFKIKVSALFESAVAEKVSTIKTAFATTLADLEEEMEKRTLAESADLSENLVNRVDGYLDYVVEQWLEKNELALERGIKTDLFESFMSGMQGLFKEHMINVPEDKIEVLESQNAKIEELQDQVDTVISENVNLKQELKIVAKSKQITEAAYGLSDAELERFTALAEEISYETPEVFGKKLAVIRERIFGHTETNQSVNESLVNDSELIEEEVAPQNTRNRNNVDESISALAARISRSVVI